MEGSPEKQAAREERKAQKAAEKAAKKEAERSAVLAEIKEKNQVRPFTEEERAAQSEPDLSEIEPEQLSFVPIDHFQELPKTPPAASSSPASAQEKKESVEEMEDDGEVLEFEISEEAENRDYELPSAELLDSIPATDQSSEYKKIEQNIGVLEKTFQSFGVDAKV